MPTEAQMKARAGADMLLEPFAIALSLQSRVKREQGAWEALEHGTWEGFRRQAEEWIERALVGGVGLEDMRQRAPGSLL